MYLQMELSQPQQTLEIQLWGRSSWRTSRRRWRWESWKRSVKRRGITGAPRDVASTNDVSPDFFVFFRSIILVRYEYVKIYSRLYKLNVCVYNPCPDRKVWLEVWFGGMIRGYDSGYDSRVWFAGMDRGAKNLHTSTGRELSLSLSFTGPARYQLN